MANTLKLENQDGDFYYRDFQGCSGYSLSGEKIRVDGVYHRDDNDMVFFVHGINFKNKEAGELYVEMLNEIMREGSSDILYKLLEAAAYNPLHDREI